VGTVTAAGKANMQVDVYPVVPAEWRDAAWRFYRDTFAPLSTIAVQRHVLHETEFGELIGDARIDKYLAVRDGQLVGMSAMTADLDAVHLISPEYFAHHWPGLYAERRILYCVFVGVHPGPRESRGVFVGLQEAMYRRQVGPVGGVCVLDICTYNEEERKLPWAIESIMQTVAGAATVHRLDSQTYWLYDFSGAN
jgi:hypothetical protein